MGLLPNKNKDKGAAAPAAPAAAADKGAGRGRKSQFTGKRIYVKAKENPYRKDSKRFTEFALIKEGMPVEDFLKAGGSIFNLGYGVDRAHYSVR